MAMHLRWDPEPGDWADGMRAAVPFLRWVPWYALALLVLGGVLLALGQWLPGVFGLVGGAVVGLLPVVGVWWGFRRDPVSGKTMTADVTERSIRLTLADGSAHSEVRFSSLTGWLETKRSFVLRTGGQEFHLVPGRAFAETADIDRFRSWLVAALGPSAKR